MRKTLMAALEEEQTVIDGGTEPEPTDQHYDVAQEQVELEYQETIRNILDNSDLNHLTEDNRALESISLEGFTDQLKAFLLKMKELFLKMVEKIVEYWNRIFNKNERIKANIQKIEQHLANVNEDQVATEDARHLSEADIKMLSINGAFSGNLSTDLNNVSFFGEKLMNLSTRTIRNINKMVDKTEYIVTSTDGFDESGMVDFLRDVSLDVIQDYESVFTKSEDGEDGMDYHTTDLFLGDREFYFATREDSDKIIHDIVAGIKNADNGESTDLKYRKMTFEELRRITDRFKDFDKQNTGLMRIKTEFEKTSSRLIEAIDHFHGKAGDKGDLHEMKAIHSLFKTMQQLLGTVNKLPMSYINYTEELSDAYTRFATLR